MIALSFCINYFLCSCAPTLRHRHGIVEYIVSILYRCSACFRLLSCLYSGTSNRATPNVTVAKWHKHTHSYTATRMNTSTYFNGKMFCFCRICAESMAECDKDKCYFMAKTRWPPNQTQVDIVVVVVGKKYCTCSIVLLLHGIGGIIIINHSESVSLFELANRFCINVRAAQTHTHTTRFQAAKWKSIWRIERVKESKHENIIDSCNCTGFTCRF